MKNELAFLKEEFTSKEIVFRIVALVCAYPVGVLIGYVLERIKFL